jgi:predicted Zn-dependent protease
LQKVDLELANKNPAAAYTAALAGHKRWPERRSFALRVGQALQLMGKDREAITFLKEQVKRWPSDEPAFFQMMATSQERLGDQVAARQEMARYYVLVGALPAAVTQLQQARSLTNDFYLQSQIDVEVRELTQKIARDRRLLEKFR